MKKSGDSKMATKLLFINKNTNDKIYEEKKEIKSLTTITAKANTNPFAYLLRDEKKEEIKYNDHLTKVCYISVH